MRRSRRRSPSGDRIGFEYVSDDDVYLDSACQTLRPQPVIDAMNEYYAQYSACGGRVKYEWGRRVDERVQATRDKVVRAFRLSPRRFSASFTLNTTYGINLLLHQLPEGRYAKVVTTHTEHNSVFLPTMSFARSRALPRLVLDRADDGTIEHGGDDLRDAIVVVSAMNNVDGTVTAGLAELVDDVHRAGGSIIVDAAQAAPHALPALRGIPADAYCFSAHKMYGASLGVVVGEHDFLGALDPLFIGGGQVAGVTESDFTMLAEPTARLEAGLQAWGEIIALGAAIDWLEGFASGAGESLWAHEERLARRLFDGIQAMPHVELFNREPSTVLSFAPTRVDAHRLATFLSRGGIMARSGHFCAHHWLQETRPTPPLVRLSLGAHNTEADVDRALEVTGRLMKGL